MPQGLEIVFDRGGLMCENTQMNIPLFLKGWFKFWFMTRGQKVLYQIQGCDDNGLLKLIFSKPAKPNVFYHYLPAKKDAFGDQPDIVDEVAEEYVEIRKLNGNLVRYNSC